MGPYTGLFVYVYMYVYYAFIALYFLYVYIHRDSVGGYVAFAVSCLLIRPTFDSNILCSKIKPHVIQAVRVRKSNNIRFEHFVFWNCTTCGSNISCSKTKPCLIQTFRVRKSNHIRFKHFVFENQTTLQPNLCMNRYLYEDYIYISLSIIIF